jgi:hypothetical protein
MTRLTIIADRQSKTRLRDALFAACVALTAAVSIITVSTASHAASSAQISQR